MSTSKPQHHGTVCKTCRKRAKKCDKLLPECSTCLDKGIKCDGYAFRWSGVASRGRLAGKEIPIADPNKSKNRQKAPTYRKAPRQSMISEQSTPHGMPLFEDSEPTDQGTHWESVLAATSVTMTHDDLGASFAPDLSSLDPEDICMDIVEPDTTMNITSEFPYASSRLASGLPGSLYPLNFPVELKFILEYCKYTPLGLTGVR